MGRREERGHTAELHSTYSKPQVCPWKTVHLHEMDDVEKVSQEDQVYCDLKVPEPSATLRIMCLGPRSMNEVPN